MGITRATLYTWIDNDKELSEAKEEIDESMIDDAEGVIHKLIREENVTALIFYLKTKAKHRGYVERTDIDIKSGGQSLVPKYDFSQLSKEQFQFLVDIQKKLTEQKKLLSE